MLPKGHTRTRQGSGGSFRGSTSYVRNRGLWCWRRLRELTKWIVILAMVVSSALLLVEGLGFLCRSGFHQAEAYTKSGGMGARIIRVLGIDWREPCEGCGQGCRAQSSCLSRLLRSLLRQQTSRGGTCACCEPCRRRTSRQLPECFPRRQSSSDRKIGSS
jgi:hypothetical protein